MDYKRDADAILNGLKSLETSGGRLRVFFGMCPGVGKTYSMLRAARELKAQGIDVLVGVVETHGRLETETMLEGLDVLPRRTLSHRETNLSEFDIDAALQRKPHTILIDELAHTNVPGSRHPKRFQDVEELLAAGINVMTTMNVQHLESRADLVEQMTGVHIRERVPDSFLDRADPIELIDLSPEQLLKRLEEGKVYRGDVATRARDAFFKEEHLTALREIALRFTADLVDDRLLKTMSARGVVGPWNAGEKLLVAVSHSPYSARLIRACRRTAATLGAPWIALHVQDREILTDEDTRQLRKNLELARELGAELFSTVDSDIAAAIQRIAAEQNVTQIVMGRPDRRPLRDLFTHGTLLQQLVSETSNIDIHVIRQIRKPKVTGLGSWISRRFAQGFAIGSGGIAYWQTLWLMIGVGVFSYGLTDLVGYRAVGYVFLLAVLLVASLASFGPIVFAAALGAFSWNFFFIPPTFTLRISNHEDWFLTVIYFVVAVVGGMLSHRIRTQRQDILNRERQTRALYDMTRALTVSTASENPEKEMAESALEVIRQTFTLEGVLLLVPSDGRAFEAEHILAGKRSLLSPKTLALADWVAKNGKVAGDGTDTLSATGAFAGPIRGPDGILAILLLPAKPASLDHEVLLERLLEQLGLSLDRVHLARQNEHMRLAEQSERLYQTVLNSVSHELKTPLTTLVGAAGAIVSAPALKQALHQETDLRPLVEDISDAAERMKRVVENLLDISRLNHIEGSKPQDILKRELVDWSDHVGQTVALLKRELRHHIVQLDLTPDDVIVSIDEKLMEHAIANLITNAAAYSPSGSTIAVRTSHEARGVEHFAVLSVRDTGPGIAPEYRRRIFEKFFRIPGSKAGGTGLGLSLVQQIVSEHGGDIELNVGYTNGAEFIMRLPIRQEDAHAP